MSERVTTAVLAPDEEELDGSLRPRSLDEFVGQERVKEQLGIALEAAKARGEALDHVLLVGPPGLGKTSLAFIIREELGVGIRTVAGPALERKGDMAAILTALWLGRPVTRRLRLVRKGRLGERLVVDLLRHQRRPYIAGADRVAGYALLGGLERGDLGQAEHAVLGGDVGRLEG